MLRFLDLCVLFVVPLGGLRGFRSPANPLEVGAILSLLVFGVWWSVFGVWCLVLGVWCLVFTIQGLVFRV